MAEGIEAVVALEDFEIVTCRVVDGVLEVEVVSTSRGRARTAGRWR